ncbi:microtubule associated protein (Ytm1) [Blumeria hordei DH14]|uniref:Ribosome biogenesis protein YTM1 n=1 Tax=Blumeria graminis f. sp. hordei (strain DH14) TaxID=546991 RepID=N1JF45_BLUG1|nr:microtubule associated protein (Ytm1) [Blumeria hordei DH14]
MEDFFAALRENLLILVDVQRYGLSQILNSESMLSTSVPIPFDFLINGSFLRTSLEEYLRSNGLSSETRLNLQYVRSLIPPSYKASFEHDDWVSCVDAISTHSLAGSWGGNNVPIGRELILSGSYDGLLRIWNQSGQVITTSGGQESGGHLSSIKAAKFISPTMIASTSLDRTIKVWKFAQSDDGFNGKLTPKLTLYGHRGAVESIDVHGPSGRMISGSNDGTMGVWSFSKNTAPEAPASLLAPESASKRRKLETMASTPQRGPLSILSSNLGPVTAVIFNPLDSTVGYSASQDHSIRTFDLTTSILVDTRTTSHPLLSLVALPGISTQLLAAGNSARHITLIDPRVSAQSTQVMTLRGHTNKVVSLASDPESNYGLVSGSHDGTCRIWDLRSSRSGTKEEGNGVVSEAVYVIEREGHQGKRPVGGEGIKVFGVHWDKEVGMVSGGEDKKVQINHGRGVTRPTT